MLPCARKRGYRSPGSEGEQPAFFAGLPVRPEGLPVSIGDWGLLHDVAQLGLTSISVQ
jgi:hypothetical protein